jgi:hypothetical protein
MRLNTHGSFILSNGHSGPGFQTKDGSGISGTLNRTTSVRFSSLDYSVLP